ncbi:MAG TPA: O-methyltransferase [Thermoanaerobaculia bacterium]|nr:O-methyltransferase [Thermoanaerobaculia bacterium]
MKSAIDAILHKEQALYLESLVPPPDALLQRMEALAQDEGHPIADREVAHLMRILIRIAKPARILEIGTNIGYSVVVMGRELSPDATIETIEIDRSTLETARQFVAEAALPCDVVFHEGAALDVLASLTGTFDFVFIDCVKTEYGDYLDELMDEKLSKGALIVCDNLLWKGQVAAGARSPDQVASTAALARFNRRIVTDPRLLSTILPVGDGVGLSWVMETR